MFIEIGAPASLPLGLVRLECETGLKTGLLGVTVQHPPVNLFAQAYPGLKITGARADLAYEQTGRFLQHHHLAPKAEVEIELAIPGLIGLGSETMLGLSMAQALAWLNGLPVDDTAVLAQGLGLAPQHALEIWGFDQGGLLLVDIPAQAGALTPPIRRFELAHRDNEAWVFVLFLPRIPADTPETLEADSLETLLRAAPYLSLESGRLVHEQLWPALESDDLVAFAQSLLALHQLTQAALAQAGSPLILSAEEQTILDLMRAHGALAWGRSLTGLGLYGLVKGASASIELRKKLRDHVGFFGGTVMATITDNRGAHYVVKDYNLADKILM